MSNPVGFILTDEEVWSLWNSQATDDMNMQEAATFARAIESAVLRKLRERPADAWMRDSWGPDCGPFVELYKSSEMGWRDKEGWTPLHIIPEEHE